MQTLFNDGFIRVTEQDGAISVFNVSGNTQPDKAAMVVINPHYKTLKIYLDSGKFELVSLANKNPYIKIHP